MLKKVLILTICAMFIATLFTGCAFIDKIDSYIDKADQWLSETDPNEDFGDISDVPVWTYPGEGDSTNSNTNTTTPTEPDNNETKPNEDVDVNITVTSDEQNPLVELDTNAPNVQLGSLQPADISTDDLMMKLDEILFNEKLQDYERDIIFKSTAKLNADVNGEQLTGLFVSNYTRCEPYTHGVFKSLLDLPSINKENIFKDEHIEYYIDSEEFNQYTKSFKEQNQWVDNNKNWYETSWNMTLATDFTNEAATVKMNNEFYVYEINDTVILKSGDKIVASSTEEVPILFIVKKDFSEFTIYLSDLQVDSSSSYMVGCIEIAKETENAIATVDAVLQWRYFVNIDQEMLKAPQNVIEEAAKNQ